MGRERAGERQEEGDRKMGAEGGGVFKRSSLKGTKSEDRSCYRIDTWYNVTERVDVFGTTSNKEIVR